MIDRLSQAMIAAFGLWQVLVKSIENPFPMQKLHRQALKFTTPWSIQIFFTFELKSVSQEWQHFQVFSQASRLQPEAIAAESETPPICACPSNHA